MSETPPLFDVVDPDSGARTSGVFRAPAPKRARRAMPPPPPVDAQDLGRRAAAASDRIAAQIAAARARADAMDGELHTLRDVADWHESGDRGPAAMDAAMDLLGRLTAEHGPQAAAELFNETMHDAKGDDRP